MRIAAVRASTAVREQVLKSLLSVCRRYPWMTKRLAPAKDSPMGKLRAFMGDRVTGGIAAGLTGYLLVLQVFVAALTCGMTIPVEAGPQFVLCQPSQFSADRSAGNVEGDDHAFVHVCPCVICHTDELGTVALVPTSPELGLAYTSHDQIEFGFFDNAAAPIDPGRLGLAPAPRGPPSSHA